MLASSKPERTLVLAVAPALDILLYHGPSNESQTAEGNGEKQCAALRVSDTPLSKEMRVKQVRGPQQRNNLELFIPDVHSLPQESASCQWGVGEK